MKVSVLNGEITVGDLVALAVRRWNTAVMVVGRVTGFENRKEPYTGNDVVRVKIHVLLGGWGANRTIGCEVHSRMIKLPSETEGINDV